MNTIRIIAVRSLWAVADTIDIVRDGLIVAASKIVTRPNVTERVEKYTERGQL